MRLALGIEHDLRFAPSSVGTLWEQSYRRLARMRKLRVLLDMRDIRFPGPSELATPLCLNSPFPPLSTCDSEREVSLPNSNKVLQVRPQPRARPQVSKSLFTNRERERFRFCRLVATAKSNQAGSA